MSIDIQVNILYMYIYIYTYKMYIYWANYNNSLTWNNAILGWFAYKNNDSSEVAVRSL